LGVLLSLSLADRVDEGLDLLEVVKTLGVKPVGLNDVGDDLGVFHIRDDTFSVLAELEDVETLRLA
jgi:hypothetical protein